MLQWHVAVASSRVTDSACQKRASGCALARCLPCCAVATLSPPFLLPCASALGPLTCYSCVFPLADWQCPLFQSVHNARAPVFLAHLSWATTPLLKLNLCTHASCLSHGPSDAGARPAATRIESRNISFFKDCDQAAHARGAWQEGVPKRTPQACTGNLKKPGVW